MKVSFGVNPALSYSESDFWLGRSSRTLRNDRPDLETLTGHLSTPNGNARVTLYMNRAICQLEFNAARVGWGKSEELWPPQGITPLVHALIDQVREHAWPAFVQVTDQGEIVWEGGWARHVKVRRIDLARNFVVSDPDLVKRVLPNIVASNARLRAEYQDTKGGWTLVNGTKRSGQDRLYDKSAELESSNVDSILTQSAERLFRFETQIQKERLSSLGLATLADLDEAACWGALESRWRATRWGSPLPTTSPWLPQIAGLSSSVAERLVGYLVLKSQDIELGTPSHRRDMAKLSRLRGFTPGLPLDMQGVTQQHLSLAEGRLVNDAP